MDLSLALRVPSYVARRAQAFISPGFGYGETVVQLFLNEPQRKTTFTFTNVASLFAPLDAAGCKYELTLYGPQGKRIGRTKIEVPVYGSAQVRLEDHLRGPLPERGLLVARVRSTARLHQGARHLGPIKPHFYAFYHSPDMSSMGLIHPQTGLTPKPSPEARWISNLHVDLEGLSALEAYQINPSSEDAQSTVRLLQGERVVAEETGVIPPRGSRCVRFATDALRAADGFVRLSAHGITADNAKPLLFQVRRDGTFVASHS